MKHVRRSTQEQYVYSFTHEQIFDLLVAHLRKERWELPHSSEIADKRLVEHSDRFEFIVEKVIPKDVLVVMPLRQVGEPQPTVEVEKLTSEELFEMAAKIEVQEVHQKKVAKLLPVVQRQITAPVKPLCFEDAVKKILSSQRGEFTINDIMEEMKVTDKVDQQRIRYILNTMAATKVLSRRKAGNYKTALCFYSKR